MPTYEYRCSICDHRYETREGFDAPAKQTCPSCGGPARRVLFPPPIVFKGSGFYITDSRKGSSQVTVDSSTPTAVSPASTPAKSDGAASDGASSNGASGSSNSSSATPSTNHDA